MPRKRKPSHAPKTPPEAASPAPVTPPAEPDVFDAARAGRQAVRADPPSPEREKSLDPRRLAHIALTADENGGPKVVLWRNNAGREMAVTFDEKPDPPHLQTLKDAGFRWQGETKAWTKPMDVEKKWATHLDAERVFYQVGNAIRAARGLEPVQGVGV